MAALLWTLVLAQQEDTAEEGLHIIVAMLIVGLLFIGVVALGELSTYLQHRRRRH